MASTPVRALHPAEKALRTRKTETASSAWVGTRDRPMGASPRPRGWIKSDADDGQQADDEDEGGQEKGAGTLAQSAEVESGDDQQDPQAHRAPCRGVVDGKAEVSAPTPAAMETATVRV